jgi:hypothetical protein
VKGISTVIDGGSGEVRPARAARVEGGEVSCAPTSGPGAAPCRHRTRRSATRRAAMAAPARRKLRERIEVFSKE